MATPSEDSLASVLEAKLAALEKRFSELELKYQTLSGSSSTVIQGTDKGKADAAGTTDSKSSTEPTSDAKTDDKNIEPSQHSRVKILKTVKDPSTGERVEQLEKSQNLKLDVSGDHAFILKKKMQELFLSDEEDSSEIDIVNPDLWELLKKHLGHHPNHIFRGGPVTLHSPYDPFIFEWDALQNAAAQDPKDKQDEQARGDLKLLLDVISGGSSGDAKLDKYFKGRDVCVQQEKIQFDDLWTLFPPGALIYGKPFQDQDQLFIVQDNMGTWPDHDDRPQQFLPWRLKCWTYDWIGEIFQRTSFTLLFDPYDGYRPISALPYFPFEKHPHHDKIKSELVDRGKDFRRLCTAKEGSRLFEYKGDAIFGKKGFSGLIQTDDDGSDTRSRSVWDDFLGIRRHRSRIEAPQSGAMKSSHIESRVMVDYLSYFQYGPPSARNGVLEPNSDNTGCSCSDCHRNDGLASIYRTRFDTIPAQKRDTWEDEQYILCPPRVLGYILADKQWAQLQVSLVRDIPRNDPENAWHSRLRLADNQKTKNLLFDLVRSHSSSTMNNTEDADERNRLKVNDFIPGKGNGLVILLYGPPGVGKTSTAETIAIATRKPLFSISVSDVGTKAKHVESNLSRIFALATSWQAILLIDEADVFLESRGRGPATSTDKNALVSVFLRVLEYYQGIMFLTTNQIAQFDVAIPSRIHVAIQYQSLKAQQMKDIFVGFIKPLDDSDLVEDYQEIMEWLDEDVYSIGFDGRQIRNIVTTALGLARAEFKHRKGKGKLNKNHLKTVINNTRAFKADFLVQYDRYISAQEKMIK
ncbi:hypothetical protein TWF506_011367 [Arthrobotrys conoides]|uniref:AAA+ ATPase domain-containing protein n=1 Tax=Arthrobotrys conoides TaxID=74498 RepID=A0AAN8NAH0_9PEZI